MAGRMQGIEPLRIGEFIVASNACASNEELVTLFDATLRDFGFDKFIYSVVRRGFIDDQKIAHGIVRSYPEDWMKHYADSGYVDSDPTYRQILRRKGPFAWRDLDETLALSKKEKRVMREAEDAGLRSGMTMSIYGAYGEIVGLGFASETENGVLSKNELSDLFAISNQFHLAYTASDEKMRKPPIALSDRQREILEWTAAGKSGAVIAELLNISEDAVDYHFRNIFRKLACNSRTVAVLKSVRLGLIRV